ncbi:Hypothetical predicted protein [Olea europaea subsp. europaea]|uniref:Dirigent protein n=2 Tax=Olea europaea subsp. europaea TaxID=158383 RepID=A0A8S0T5Z8_OLEEU|nr:Hypothetical predicted protein [Olea europaea subsp. europaea]
MNMLEEEGLRNLCQGNEKFGKLHFYVQDVLGGLNATVLEVAQAEITSNSPTSFGQVRVIDDLMTAEADSSSAKLGRAQGLVTFADLENSGLAMNINFIFTAGIYNGSTLSVLGRNLMTEQNRELTVVGGTGIFRLAWDMSFQVRTRMILSQIMVFWSIPSTLHMWNRALDRSQVIEALLHMRLLH